MDNLDFQILKLIQSGFTMNDIVAFLNLPVKNLWERLSRLRKFGYTFKRKYYYSGDIVYEMGDLQGNNELSTSIITTPEDQKFVALVMSDLHLGRIGDGERLDLLNKCFNFCAKEDIHIIINGGDFIDSFYERVLPDDFVRNQNKQIEHALNEYPYDKSILSFVCFGNHDYHAYNNTGASIAIALNECRHDIVPIGYGFGSIQVKNNSFGVYHKLCNGTKPELNNINTFLLRGHSHLMRYHFRNSIPVIFIPALLDDPDHMDYLHSVVKLTIDFKSGYFKTGYIEQYLVDYDFQPISSFIFELNTNKKFKENEHISLEEPPLVRKRV